MKNAIWITWEHQLRNRSMASAFDIPLYVIDYKGKRLQRYLVCMLKTMLILFKVRPKVVFAQNPSVVLNYFLLLLKPLFRYRFVSDAHFAGVEAFNGSRLFQMVLNMNNRLSDAVIVTNNDHALRVEKIGGKAFVCEDPLPDISKYYEPSQKNEKIVFFICSFDIDEPYEVAFNAAKLLYNEGYRFYVSGNYRKADINPLNYSHINFLGYVSESSFYSYLYKSQVVLDLTTNENCLVCGAYEAMAAKKPLVTSNRKILKSYFYQGTIFTEHDEQGIAQAVRYAYEQRNELKNDISKWTSQVAIDNNNKIHRIIEYIFQNL